MTAPLHAPLKAYGAAIAGIGLFSVMDMVIKVLVIDIGTYSTMVYRSICGAILASLVALVLRPGRPTGPALRLHVLRGVIAAAMSFLFFWGLGKVPMAQAVTPRRTWSLSAGPVGRPGLSTSATRLANSAPQIER